MQKMKDSGIEWIGEIPNEWKIERNKNLFYCSKNIVGRDWENTQLLSLTTKGIKEKSFDDITGKVPENFDTYQVVEPNDIVMCLFDLDVSAVFSGISHNKGMISPAYKVLKCKFGLIPEFTDYWFNFVFVDRKFKTYSKNIRYTLNYDEFAMLPILQPTVSEQKRIAEYLYRKCSEIDSIINETEKTIEEYKTLKQSVITEAVTKGIRGDRPMKDSGIEWIGEIPNTWNCIKLKYCSKIRNEKCTHNNGNNYFALENIESWTGRYIPTENEYDTTGAIKCYKNDIAFGKLRPYLAKIFNVDDNRCCSSEFAVFYDFYGWYRYYYYLMLSYGFVAIVDMSTYGTKMPRANIDYINNLFIPIPTEIEQKEISDYLDKKCTEIDNLIEKKKALIEELKTYKKSLIYEYVTGKKEVPNAN